MATYGLLVTALALASFVPAVPAGAYDSPGDGIADSWDRCCGARFAIEVNDEGQPLGELERDCDADLEDYAPFGKSFTGPLPPCLPCTVSDDCAIEEYCAKLLGDCDGEGTCTLRPVVCPRSVEPVCGCDGVTYSNACYAAAAGQSVDYPGECGMPCFENDDCPADQYCAKYLGDCDGEGQCADRLPDIVQCFAVWDPVCGCDGETYSNACYAAKAAVNMDYLGECQ